MEDSITQAYLKNRKGNPNYRRGRALEYLIQAKLEKQGYFVIRAAGSHGVADLVAIKYDGKQHEAPIPPIVYYTHEILFVSCKIPMYAPPNERNLLITTANNYGATPMMTVKDKAGKWILQSVEA